MYGTVSGFHQIDWISIVYKQDIAWLLTFIHPPCLVSLLLWTAFLLLLPHLLSLSLSHTHTCKQNKQTNLRWRNEINKTPKQMIPVNNTFHFLTKKTPNANLYIKERRLCVCPSICFKNLSIHRLDLQILEFIDFADRISYDLSYSSSFFLWLNTKSNEWPIHSF